MPSGPRISILMIICGHPAPNPPLTWRRDLTNSTGFTIKQEARPATPPQRANWAWVSGVAALFAVPEYVEIRRLHCS